MSPLFRHIASPIIINWRVESASVRPGLAQTHASTTRFAVMVKVFARGKRSEAMYRWLAACTVVAIALALLSPGRTVAQPPTPARPATPGVEKKAGTPKTEPAKAKD